MAVDDDDDPTVGWGDGDTFVDLDPGDLQELEADAPTTEVVRNHEAVTPPRGVETLIGYEVGRRDAERDLFEGWNHLLVAMEHRGMAKVLHVVRDHMLEDGAPPAIADVIIAALARRAGVVLG